MFISSFTMSSSLGISQNFKNINVTLEYFPAFIFVRSLTGERLRGSQRPCCSSHHLEKQEKNLFCGVATLQTRNFHFKSYLMILRALDLYREKAKQHKQEVLFEPTMVWCYDVLLWESYCCFRMKFIFHYEIILPAQGGSLSFPYGSIVPAWQQGMDSQITG